MTAQLSPSQELERQRAIAVINIIRDANELQAKVNRLEYTQLKMSELIIAQKNQISGLQDQIELQTVIDSVCAATNIQFYNENVDLRESLNKKTSTVKVLTWTSIGLAALTTLLIISR